MKLEKKTIKKKENKMNDLLQEKANPASEANVHRGAFNEAMFAYHLNGGNWIDEEHKKAAFHHKDMLDKHDESEARRQNDRAYAQVQSFLEHAKERGYGNVNQVHLTAKPGDIERKTGIKASQQENPSDVIAHFQQKPKDAEHGYFGASLKSSKVSKIGFHNGGAGTIGKQLGIDLEEIQKKHNAEFSKKNKLPGKMAQAKRAVTGEKGKAGYRDNPLYEKAMVHAAKINNETRDRLHQHYSTMDTETAKDHLIKTYIKASNSNALPYVKTHGMGGHEKAASAYTEDPGDNETYHAIRNAKNIEFKKGGGTGIDVHADGRKVMALQVKHNNGPFTSMKVIAK
jgi:hypothetical protein